MANMNIKTEKILSPSNIKKIIMLGISLRDELENAEKGLISDYDSTQTYTRGQAVYYDNYLYKCLYTTTGTWDSTKWQKIGDELDLITKADIEAMLGLTQEEIASLQSLISTEIRLDKCFSSSDTYNRLLTVENECKKFTLEQLAKKAGVVYKVVADTTGVDSTEFLYLISNGSNGYNIYAYIDGSAVKISDTNINLDDYAKLSDLDDFVKKTDADGKYATITTVDGKVDKTSILSTISSTPSDDKLLSEKAIKAELDTINTNLDDKIDKASITTTIGSTSTDSELPTAKTVYSNVKYASGYTDTIVIDCNECIKVGYYFADRNTTNNPTSETYGILHVFGYKTDIESKNTQWIFQEFTSASGKKYMRYSLNPNSLTPTNWTSWERLCSTSVADVEPKTINPTFPSTVTLGSSQRIIYSIKNGWANVSTVMQFSSPKLSWTVIATGLPKPDKTVNTSTLGETFVNANVAYRIKTDGTLEMRIDSEITKLNWWNINVSYPVVEEE